METKTLNAKEINLSNPKDKQKVIDILSKSGDCTVWVRSEQIYKDGNRGVQLSMIKKPIQANKGLKRAGKTHLISFYMEDNAKAYKVNSIVPFDGDRLELASKIKYFKNAKHINVLTTVIETQNVLDALTAQAVNTNTVQVNESLLTNEGDLITFNVKPTAKELNALLDVATTDTLKADLQTACNICGFNLEALKAEYAVNAELVSQI